MIQRSIYVQYTACTVRYGKYYETNLIDANWVREASLIWDTLFRYKTFNWCIDQTVRYSPVFEGHMRPLPFACTVKTALDLIRSRAACGLQKRDNACSWLPCTVPLHIHVIYMLNVTWHVYAKAYYKEVSHESCPLFEARLHAWAMPTFLRAAIEFVCLQSTRIR